MTELRVERVESLAPDTSGAARALLWRVFDEMTEHDWRHCLGGSCVLARDGRHLVGFAAVVPRLLRCDDRPVRAGYVEGVAVAPTHRRCGVGSRVMAEVERIVRNDYELGALGASEEALPFYRARGWWPWRGRTFAATADGPVRTADEDDCVLVYPVVALELSGDLTCDAREGDAW
ncbi:GNAT family N-acetyltransferase [Saccharopolyspora halophila]|uniref:GNAT family N-acetyltransferase n=1 Tax=Saccharopolyspora halophila TaxID=405551 RepID=A0ABP5T460_9PSEU